MRCLILALLFTLAPAGTVQAEAQGAADPARVAEAIRLLDAENFESATMHSVDVGTEAMLGVITEQLKKQFGDTLPDDFIGKMRDTMRSHAEETMREKLPDVKRRTAELYAKEFTLVELARLREIAADPVIVKSRKWSREVEPTMVMLGIDAMRATQDDLDAKLKRLVADYVKSLGATPTS